MNGPLRFRKKPIEIEAMQWLGVPTPSILPSATRVIDWVLANGGTARYHEERTHDTSEVVGTGEVKSFERPEPVPEHIAIDTLEGTMRALPGDYIIRGVQGEFYPCKPDIFWETYDELTAAAHPLSSSKILVEGSGVTVGKAPMTATVQVCVVAEGQPVTGPVIGTVNVVAPPSDVDEVRAAVTAALRGGRAVS